MRCIFLPNNFKPDYLIYDNLINILTNSILNKSCCLDKETSLLLEQPINLLNYSNIEPDEDVEEYSKFELGMMVNNLLKERQYITELFERVDKERKKLREDNFHLLEQIFFKSEIAHQENYHLFFNRCFGLNYEFMGYSLEKERTSLNECKKLMAKQSEEIKDLNSKIVKLEQKLVKSRENLKQYLVTGKINPEEISSLGLTSHKINIDVHQDSTAGVTNDNNQIDFSQDWEKISLNSHNSNLILFNNKKNSSNLNFSGSKQALNPPALNNKMKLQETKTKIDKYFNKNSKSPDHLLKKGLITQLEKNQENIQSSHLKINHIEAVKSFDIKSEKVEKVISTKNIITPKTVIPKIIPHNTDNKNLTLNRPASQSKIHLKKNNVSEMNKK